jgi:hypothetical protein
LLQHASFTLWLLLAQPCSGDLFLGKATKQFNSLYFSGHHNTLMVLQDIRAELQHAERIVIAGAGHGGMGAMAHVDLIQEMFPEAIVRGLSLGAWYLPYDDFGSGVHTLGLKQQAVTKGVDSMARSWEAGLRLWAGGEGRGVFVDETCVAVNGAEYRVNAAVGSSEATLNMSTRCFSPPQLLPFVHTPCFHASNIFDTAQLISGHHMPAEPTDPRVRDYVERFGAAMLESVSDTATSIQRETSRSILLRDPRAARASFSSEAAAAAALRYNGHFNGYFFLSCFAHDQFDSSFSSSDTSVAVGGSGGRAGSITLQSAFASWLDAVDAHIAYNRTTSNDKTSGGAAPLLIGASGKNATFVPSKHRWIEDCDTPAPTAAPTNAPTADPTGVGDTNAPTTAPTENAPPTGAPMILEPRIPPFPCNANSKCNIGFCKYRILMCTLFACAATAIGHTSATHIGHTHRQLVTTTAHSQKMRLERMGIQQHLGTNSCTNSDAAGRREAGAVTDDNCTVGCAHECTTRQRLIRTKLRELFQHTHDDTAACPDADEATNLPTAADSATVRCPIIPAVADGPWRTPGVDASGCTNSAAIITAVTLIKAKINYLVETSAADREAGSAPRASS